MDTAEWHRRRRNKYRHVAETYTPGVNPTRGLNRAVGYGALRRGEGYISVAQGRYLYRLLRKNPRIRTVMQVGFNAGHSACWMLAARPSITVVSFDLGRRDYVKLGHDYLEETYPGRHTLVVGDSADGLPIYREQFPDQLADLFFLDGGHEGDIVQTDFDNARAMSATGWVVMDDMVGWQDWGAEPVRVWRKAVAEGTLTQLALVQDGRVVPEIRRKPYHTTAMAVGRWVH